jgi:glutamate carboxypeptidase
MTPHETLQYFRTRQSAIVDAIREIVDIESPSHDAVRSREVVDWVEAKMRSTGIEATFERIKVDDGEHLIIRAFPSAEPHTFILGHTDTVHPVGTHLQNPTRIEGDKFYGCGIFDMKANIVLMFEALRYCAVNGRERRSRYCSRATKRSAAIRDVSMSNANHTVPSGV